MAEVAGEALYDLFPHRARNVLVDRVDVPLTPGSQRGTGWLSLSEGDALGRDIVLGSSEEGRYVLSPFAAEYIALTSLCVLKPDLGPHDICFFSTISDVEFSGRLSAAGVLRAEVERQKDRGPFKRFTGRVLDDSSAEVLSQADIMAFTLDEEAARSADDKAGKRVEPPTRTCSKPAAADLFSWKTEPMVFADEVVDLGKDTITTRYVYPGDHPFCEGHFPGNPVMMGVTQWQMAEDAVWLLAREAGLSGRVSASGGVIRPDGELVAEVKGLVVDCGSAPPLTVGLRKIAFRGMVRPGQEVFCRLDLEC